MARREFQIHASVAARCHETLCRRIVFDLVANQKVCARGATEPVVSIGQIRRPAICIEDTRRVWQFLDLPATCLTVVAVTYGAQNRSANCLASNASTNADRCSDDPVHIQSIYGIAMKDSCFGASQAVSGRLRLAAIVPTRQSLKCSTLLFLQWQLLALQRRGTPATREWDMGRGR